MTRSLLAAVGLAYVLSFGLACDSGQTPALPDVLESDALAVTDGIVFLDRSRPSAYLVETQAREPGLRTLTLPEGPRTSFVRPPEGRGEVLIFTQGLPAGERDGELEDEVPGHLLVVGAAGELRRYPLPGRFAELTLSEDGRYAIAHSPTSFEFAPATAVVDLDAQPGAQNPVAVFPRPVKAGDTRRFSFSPVEASGVPRLLFALSENRVDIVQLEHLDRPNISITLVAESEARTLVPEQLLFDGERIFVRIANSPEVGVISLTPSADNVHGFEPSYATLATGRAVEGLAMWGEEGEERLLALGVSSLGVIEPTTGKQQIVDVRGRYHEAYPYTGRTPFDDEVRPRLFLVGPGSRVAFLDGVDESTLRFGGLEEIDTGDAITAWFPLVDQNQVVLQHDRERVSLVDLSEREVTPLMLPQQARQIVLDAERRRLWISFVDERLGTVSLGASLSTDELLLDAPAEHVLVVPGKTPHAVALHASQAGFATVFDAALPARENARALLGFFWDAVLDEESK